MLGWMALPYWRDLRSAGLRAVAALGLIVLVATPQIAVLVVHPQRILMPAQFFSMRHYMATCPGCDPERARKVVETPLLQLETT